MKSSVTRYAAKRILQLIPILIAITFLSFAMIRLAGSDVVLQRMESTGQVLNQQIIDAERARLGIDKPFLVQYGTWFSRLLSGDMGTSFVTGKPVFSVFISKLPATLLLAFASVALTVVVSIPLGVLAAVRQGRLTDLLIRFSSFVGNSMPNFFVALLLMYVFSIRLKMLPVISRNTGALGCILPAATLAVAMSAKYLRQVRATVLDELGRDYVDAARARGVRFRTVLTASVLKSCMVTIVTLLMLSIGSLLGGTAIVESIFMWDGVGKLAVDAITMRDYPLIQAYVMWMSIVFVMVNLIADISYRAIDPRVRMSGGRS
ncbi:ABC transporter permease [Collinsella sp. AGMB00827]|uniref:ABC transporter permease n=1 Tax=Collinsella ureilytica TaxID=2869515 RepID=A0ABS7MKJ5_9ACTN|nr:ABC transporter permease [Collinsella urealyticum]MBY4797601.1 ABC transporter permease [Collinsella urealyticum]